MHTHEHLQKGHDDLQLQQACFEQCNTNRADSQRGLHDSPVEAHWVHQGSTDTWASGH